MVTSLRLVVVLTELVSALYVAFFAWVLSVWHVDHLVGRRMSTTDWYVRGAEHLLYWAIVALVLAGVTYGVNHFVLGRAHRRIAAGMAAAVGAIIFLASFVGTVQFVITKPIF